MKSLLVQRQTLVHLHHLKASKYFRESVISFYPAKRVNKITLITRKLHLHDTDIKLKGEKFSMLTVIEN